MKVLVTGAAGFLGSSLCARLLEAGERDLRCFIRPGPRRERIEALVARHPAARIESFEGTLTSADGIDRAMEGVDVVYHLAASMTGAAADMFLHTVVGTKNLLEAVAKRERRPRVVLVSSFGVYGVAELGRGARVDETTPLEPTPARRDLYSQAKLRQEQLARQYQTERGIPMVVLRPGVIDGPGGPAISSRVGLNLFGLFLHLGGKNTLPLTFVDNCADAIALAGRTERALGEVYNVVDDNLPNCRDYLRAYRREVEALRSVSLPYPVTMALSRLVERYHTFSKGQLPAVFTPYKTATSWGGNRFSNEKLKQLGWAPRVSTAEGMARTFQALRSRTSAA